MPKYFDDKRKLPFAREEVLFEQVNAPTLEKLLNKQGGKVSVCVRFKGFENDCLGYVFNIEQTPEGFQVKDITKKLLLTVPNMDEVIAMMKHACGGKYNDEWQQRFQTLRNKITSSK